MPKHRTISVYNDSGEWIPAWACMEITGTREIAGIIIYEVSKPSATTPQNASMLIINGAQSIPPSVANSNEGIGQGSQDWPLQVLHQTSDTIAIGDTCGPVSGQWYVAKSGTAFSWQDGDPTNAYSSDANDGNELGLIGPAVGKPRFATCLAAGAVVAADATFSVDGVVCIQDAGANVATTLTAQNPYGFTLDDDAAVLLAYDEVNDEWLAIQGKCPV